MEDHQIIELFWARSQQAISESEFKYGAYCRAIARGILALEEDAEECVNDTWFHAWNAMPPQRPNILSAFFGKLTRNLSLDRWRKNRAAKRGGGQIDLALEELEGCLPDRHSPEEHLEAGETAKTISAFLRSQPELDRNLFVGRYFYLQSIQHLASHFGLSLPQTKSRLHRTRQRLKAVLEQEGVAV
ncbi:MAG: RNA polymerase sigma factor [Lawsonibacter sp.]|jgi:RNA polymerase sigma factor (sigma-70 family)